LIVIRFSFENVFEFCREACSSQIGGALGDRRGLAVSVRFGAYDLNFGGWESLKSVWAGGRSCSDRVLSSWTDS
jgi:hypothetical protein